jgi:hypothetical protein
LKNINPNGDDVAASNVNSVNFYFLIIKIESKTKYRMFFFLQDVMPYLSKSGLLKIQKLNSCLMI